MDSFAAIPDTCYTTFGHLLDKNTAHFRYYYCTDVLLPLQLLLKQWNCDTRCFLINDSGDLLDKNIAHFLYYYCTEVLLPLLLLLKQ